MNQHRRVAEILSKPTALLVVPTDAIRATRDQVERWKLNDADMSALVEWGVPVIDERYFIGNIQLGDAPEIEYRGSRYYSIGMYVDDEIGIDANDGAVWGIPQEGDRPRFYVNSSVALYVDISWHWYWVRQEALSLLNDVEQYDLIDDFRDYAQSVDSQAFSNDSSLWRRIVDNW